MRDLFPIALLAGAVLLGFAANKKKGGSGSPSQSNAVDPGVPPEDLPRTVETKKAKRKRRAATALTAIGGIFQASGGVFAPAQS